MFRKLFASHGSKMTVLAIALTACAAHGQSHGQVQIPNPTPRERDLHDLYADNPAQRAKAEQAIALHKAQLRLQVITDSNEILVLAQKLGQDQLKGDASLTEDSITAQKIEALAKRVRENMKSQ